MSPHQHKEDKAPYLLIGDGGTGLYDSNLLQSKQMIGIKGSSSIEGRSSKGPRKSSSKLSSGDTAVRIK